MAGSADINKAWWDERAPAHAVSPDYDLQRFVADPSVLSDVVRFDAGRLGDLTGVEGVHLQCHIGTDTVSLSRLGARMSGLDFSESSLTVARALAARAGADITFAHADVYEAVDVFGAGTFDLVFTGVGALCWLPDIGRWSRVVSGLLRPGGRLFLRDGHPVLLSLGDPRPDGLVVIEAPYFEPPEPFVYDEDGTYVRTDVRFEHTVSHSWSHGIGEIIGSLLETGMTITGLVEHDTVPWEARPGEMEPVELGEWRMIEGAERFPCTYTLQAIKA